MRDEKELALNGGPKGRSTPLPARALFGSEEKEAVVALFDDAICEGSQLLGYNGAQEEAYCKEFAEFMGGGFADGVNSGTNAVYVALRALELEPFSEVITSPITDPGGLIFTTDEQMYWRIRRHADRGKPFGLSLGGGAGAGVGGASGGGANAVAAAHFMMFLTESWTEEDAGSAVSVLRKVDAVFR